MVRSSLIDGRREEDGGIVGPWDITGTRSREREAVKDRSVNSVLLLRNLEVT